MKGKRPKQLGEKGVSNNSILQSIYCEGNETNFKVSPIVDTIKNQKKLMHKCSLAFLLAFAQLNTFYLM